MSFTIGMIVPTADNSFFACLASEAEKFLKKRGHMMLLVSGCNSADNEKTCLRKLIEFGCDGILCVSGLSELPEGLIPNDYPLVWVDRRPASSREIPWVANDDAAAMEEATDYLIEKGCRHILLLPGFVAEHHESPRVIGYHRALKKAGVEFDPDYILNRAGKDSTERETEEMIHGVMQRSLPIDGIITSSDRSAFGAIAALKSVGLYVPEDVKLISFDNSPYSTLASPGITAIDRNPAQIAEVSCATVLSLLNGGSLETEKMIPVSLVRRDSTR